MAGYSRIYCIGDEGGALGADGINPIDFQILVGNGNRQWLEVRYFNSNIRPMGKVEVIIPAAPYETIRVDWTRHTTPGPNHPDALLDACLAFFPEHFESCPSLTQVVEALGNASSIDFDLDGEPSGWAQLREEARSLFKHLIIYEAKLNKVNGIEQSWEGWHFFGEDESHPDPYKPPYKPQRD